MPSPIAHIAAGYAVYELVASRNPEYRTKRIGPVPRLLAITTGLSLLPDLDFIPGFFTERFDQFHNGASHSLVFGLGVALLVASLVRLNKGSKFGFWFFLTFVCYNLHVVMDYFTFGRGVMLLWPFSGERFLPPIMLFYGLHRSDGLVSIRHLWTAVTELLFAMFVIILVKIPQRKSMS